MMNATELEVLANDIVRSLATMGLATTTELAASFGRSASDIAQAAKALESAGVAVRLGSCWSLNDDLDCELSDRECPTRRTATLEFLYRDQTETLRALLGGIAAGQHWASESLFGLALDKACRQFRNGQDAALPMLEDEGATGILILACCVVPSAVHYGPYAYDCLCQYVNAKE